MINLSLYVAIQDEISRFNQSIHAGSRPSIYRAKYTYLIEYSELESDIIWFFCIKLEWDWEHVHIRIPFIEEKIFFCLSEDEWCNLLAQAGVQRNSYFLKQGTGQMVPIPLTIRRYDRIM